MKPHYITAEAVVLTEAEKAKFEEEYNLTSDAQKTYGQIIAGIMKKKEIDAKKAEELTRLNRKLFKNLDEPGGSIKKRFVVSIAVGFGLDVHMTEYILESCGMRFNTNDRLDKAYIYIIENYKGCSIDDCNGILRDLGVDGDDMLGELERGSYKKRSKLTEIDKKKR